MYAIGNCYCWAKILKLFYGGNIFVFHTELGPRGREVNHYMLRDRKGRIRHFKRKVDILPYPLCYLCFVGKIESSGKRRKK